MCKFSSVNSISPTDFSFSAFSLVDSIASLFSLAFFFLVFLSQGNLRIRSNNEKKLNVVEGEREEFGGSGSEIWLKSLLLSSMEERSQFFFSKFNIEQQSFLGLFLFVCFRVVIFWSRLWADSRRAGRLTLIFLFSLIFCFALVSASFNSLINQIFSYKFFASSDKWNFLFCFLKRFSTSRIFISKIFPYFNVNFVILVIYNGNLRVCSSVLTSLVDSVSDNQHQKMFAWLDAGDELSPTTPLN